MITCPRCGGTEFSVLRTLPSKEGLKRRRECAAPGCGQRITTLETVVLHGRRAPAKTARAGVEYTQHSEEFKRRIVGLRRAGEKWSVISLETGLSENAARAIVKRVAPHLIAPVAKKAPANQP